MIRLPPTSIALSDRDVDFHLEHIRISRNLLAAGFSREQIQELFAKEDRPSPQPKAAPTHASLQRTFSDRSEENSNASTPPPPSSPALPSSPPLGALHYRHAAPRQSSLLRFAQTAASESSQTEVDVSLAGNATEESRLLTMPPRRQKDYPPSDDPFATPDGPLPISEERPSQEHPGQDDEAHLPSVLPRHSNIDLRTTSAISLPIRPRPHVTTPSPIRNRDQTPGSSSPTLPPPFSSTPRNTSLQSTPNSNDHPPSTSSQSLPLPPFPPPPTSTTAVPHPIRAPSSSSPYLPSAPPVTPRRPPRANFPVYNDRLPPQTQPRTPADLSRGFYLHPTHAAYTAPPGRMHTPSASTTHQHNGNGGGPMDGSGGNGGGGRNPSMDLVESLRARRRRMQRERERAVRVEREWRERFGNFSGVRNGNGNGSGRIWRGEGGEAASWREIRIRGLATGMDMDMGWREELEADMVGEENFGDGRGRGGDRGEG